MKVVRAVVDLQFGSCGKGLLAGYLAKKHDPDTIVTAWSPNAGHTFIDSDGTKYVNTALPNGIVSKNLRRILIGPGSVINPEQFLDEMTRYQHLLDGVDIMIHEAAGVVTQAHRDAEARYAFGIGSTMKGVGEAVISKIRRPVNERVIARDALIGTPLEGLVVDRVTYAMALDQSHEVLIEGAQGFSLSINQGFYPYCTSRECTVHQLLSDCSIPRTDNLLVYGACRTYPIRVANRFKDGVQVGTSGPCYLDQHEIEWKELGMEPELTTVTQLPRRIFTWSHQQMAEALRMNRCDYVFLNFANYISRGEDPNCMQPVDYIESIRISNGGTQPQMLYGFGPTINDVRDVI